MNIDTYCGLSCEGCDYKISHNCKGCIATQGNPFHGSCELAQCAKKKNKRFCGECEDFPCEIIMRYSYDKEQGDNGARIERCKEIKSANELIEIISKFADCGWDLIDLPSKKWLTSKDDKTAANELVQAIKKADEECGSCGCEFDELYKRALVLLKK